MISQVFKTYKKPLLIAASSQGSGDHLQTILKKHGFAVSELRSFRDFKSKNPISKVQTCVLNIEEGFETPDFIMISEQDIFGDRFIRTVKKKRDAGNFMAEAQVFLWVI